MADSELRDVVELPVTVGVVISPTILDRTEENEAGWCMSSSSYLEWTMNNQHEDWSAGREVHYELSACAIMRREKRGERGGEEE